MRTPVSAIRRSGPGSVRNLRLLAILRMALGLAALARPELVPRSLGVDSATAGRVGWLVRMTGGRDVALGLGLADALRRGSGVRPWLLVTAVADAVDAAALARAVRQRRVSALPGGVGAVLAASGVVSGLLAAAAAGDE